MGCAAGLEVAAGTPSSFACLLCCRLHTVKETAEQDATARPHGSPRRAEPRASEGMRDADMTSSGTTAYLLRSVLSLSGALWRTSLFLRPACHFFDLVERDAHVQPLPHAGTARVDLCNSRAYHDSEDRLARRLTVGSSSLEPQRALCPSPSAARRERLYTTLGHVRPVRSASLALLARNPVWTMAVSPGGQISVQSRTRPRMLCAAPGRPRGERRNESQKRHGRGIAAKRRPAAPSPTAGESFIPPLSRLSHPVPTENSTPASA